MATVLPHSTRLGINYVYDDGDNAAGGDGDGGRKVMGMIMMTTTHFW